MTILIHAEAYVDAFGELHEGTILLRENGVAALGDAARMTAEELKRAATLKGEIPNVQEMYLPNQVLLPAFTNAHSHAFQRALRGRVELRSALHPFDDFWSWRHEMYAAANALSADAFSAVAAWCYGEMIKAGYGVVGEFHYVHHDEKGAPYALAERLSQGVVQAAQKVGLHIVLLNTAYERAGPGKEALPQQGRFIFSQVEDFLEHSRNVREKISGTGVSHGLAIHSIRACSSLWRQMVAEEAALYALPLHVHACEQRSELEASQAYYQKNPLQVLDDDGVLSERCSIVHATHIDASDVQLLVKNKAGVVLCPSTERNLGDGLCPISDLAKAGVALSIGSDSHARIDPVDEMRSLEDHERLRLERRNVLPSAGKSLRHVLLYAGTQAGRKALGLEVNAAEKISGDLISIPLGVTGEVFGAEAAVDAFLVGGTGLGTVQNMWVRGEQVLENGKMLRCEEGAIQKEAVRVLKSLAEAS